MTTYRRIGLAIAGLGFFVWSNIAMNLWLGQHDSLTIAWRSFVAALQADWMLILVLTDAGIFTLCALVWLGRDMRRRQVSRRQWWAWMSATIGFGCPGLLLYLAVRPGTREAESIGRTAGSTVKRV